MSGNQSTKNPRIAWLGAILFAAATFSVPTTQVHASTIYTHHGCECAVSCSMENEKSYDLNQWWEPQAERPSGSACLSPRARSMSACPTVKTHLKALDIDGVAAEIGSCGEIKCGGSLRMGNGDFRSWGTRGSEISCTSDTDRMAGQSPQSASLKEEVLQDGWLEYSVPVLCGTSGTNDAVGKANYNTIINVRNPHDRDVEVCLQYFDSAQTQRLEVKISRIIPAKHPFTLSCADAQRLAVENPDVFPEWICCPGIAKRPGHCFPQPDWR